MSFTPVEMDWSGCPLAKAYPTWEMYWEALSDERIEAALEGRAPHPATVAKFPPDHAGRPTPTDIAPADQVTSAAIMRRQYGTKDHV